MRVPRTSGRVGSYTEPIRELAGAGLDFGQEFADLTRIGCESEAVTLGI